MVEGRMRMILSPWFRGLPAYDPRATLQAVKGPVLAINGKRTGQIAAIGAALEMVSGWIVESVSQ